MFETDESRRKIAEAAKQRAQADRERRRKKKQAERQREKERQRKAEMRRFSDEMAAQYEGKQAKRNGKGPDAAPLSLSRGGRGSSYSKYDQGSSGPEAPSLGRGRSNSQQTPTSYSQQDPASGSGGGLAKGPATSGGSKLKRF